jgi:hypothetical protein
MTRFLAIYTLAGVLLAVLSAHQASAGNVKTPSVTVPPPPKASPSASARTYKANDVVLKRGALN